MSKSRDLIPAGHNLPEPHKRDGIVRVGPPRLYTDGAVGSMFNKWQAGHQTKAIQAVTARTRAEADLCNAQTAVIEAYTARQEAAARLQELPEVIASEKARRRVERHERYREAVHNHLIAETRRETVLTHAVAELVDARQALTAQRVYGHSTYELAWAKKKVEMLDVELSAAERRAILQQHVPELAPPGENTALPYNPSAKAIDDALYARRDELRADGVDTAQVDSLIARRAKGRSQ
jgi:hypothetical protein